MSAEYSVDGILAVAEAADNGDVRHPGMVADMLRAYAERIEADERAVPADSGRVVDDRLHSDSAEDVAQWLYANGHHDAAATVRNQLDVRNTRIRSLEAALAAQGQGDEDLAGYVDTEQVADMQRNGGGVLIGSFSERYGRTVPVYFRPAPPASPAGVPDGWKVPPHILAHARQMVEGHYPSHREHQVADALLKLAAAPSAPEGDGGGK